MKLFPFLLAGALIGLAGYGHAQDRRKPVAELELLSAKEIYGEAAMQCFSAAFYNERASRASNAGERIFYLQSAIRSLEYLPTIYLVARKLNGGDYPEWVDPIRKASSGENSNACLFYTKQQLENMK